MERYTHETDIIAKLELMITPAHVHCDTLISIPISGGDIPLRGRFSNTRLSILTRLLGVLVLVALSTPPQLLRVTSQMAQEFLWQRQVSEISPLFLDYRVLALWRIRKLWSTVRFHSIRSLNYVGIMQKSVQPKNN